MSDSRARAERPRPPWAGLVRLAMSEAHVDAVLEIEREAFRNPWRREHFMFEIRDNRWAANRVAIVGDAVVGYTSCWHLAPELKINNVAVHRDWRGRGVGEWLLRTAFVEAREAGCTEAQLEVRPSNAAALSLYAALGFVEIGRRRGYYEREGEDAIVMRLALDEAH